MLAQDGIVPCPPPLNPRFAHTYLHPIQLCKNAFHKIDSEKKGYLEPVELCHLYAELGISSITEMDILGELHRAINVHDMERHCTGLPLLSTTVNTGIAENVRHILDYTDMMRRANIPEDVDISFENFVNIVEVNGQAVKSR